MPSDPCLTQEFFHCNNGFQRMLNTQYSVKRGLAEAGAERVLARTLEDVPFVNDLHFRRNAKLGHAEVSLLVASRSREASAVRLRCEGQRSAQDCT